MSTLIKSLVGLIGAIILLVLLGLFTLTQWLDPNDYKSEIQELAKEQGVALSLDGDIGWQLFPSMALNIEGLALAPLAASEEPIIRIGAVAASVKLMPLFSQQVHIDGIKVDGAQIHLMIDKQGRGNWEALSNDSRPSTSTKTSKTPNESSASQNSFNLAMETLQISNSEFTLQDLASKQTLSIKEFNVNSANLNLSNKTFPFSLELIAHSSSLAAPLNLALSAEIAGSESALSLDQLKITIDDTVFKGQASIPDLSKGAFSLQLNGNHLNVDRYLVAQGEATSTGGASGNAPAGTAAPTDVNAPLLPLDTLRALEFDMQLGLQTLIAEGMEFSAIDLSARAKDGIISLDKMDAEFYQGKIKANSSVDVRGNTAKVRESVSMSAVDIDSLITALAPPTEEQSDTKISGKINANIQSQTRGNSIAEFTENLQADITLETQELQLSPINMEQHFCDLASQLSKDTQTLEEGEVSEAEKQWPELTKLRDLKGTMNIDQERLNIQSISAGLENLQIATTGYIDLKSNQYDLRLPMTLKGENSSEDGCRIKNEFVRNREMSFLHCEGPLDKLDAKSDCGLDKKAMRDLFKQYAKYKGKKKLDSKKDRLLEKANEKLGDGAGELLKGLFNR